MNAIPSAQSENKRQLCAAMAIQRRRNQRGVTLVEVVMAIVILGIAAVAIMDQFVNSVRSYAVNESVQTATQLAQECAEHVLATRRLQGYAAGTPACPALSGTYTAVGAVYAVSASSVVVTPPNSGCFTDPCRVVTVTATYNGATRASLAFLVGSY